MIISGVLSISWYFPWWSGFVANSRQASPHAVQMTNGLLHWTATKMWSDKYKIKPEQTYKIQTMKKVMIIMLFIHFPVFI
jgi:hypothetical protein